MLCTHTHEPSVELQGQKRRECQTVKLPAGSETAWNETSQSETAWSETSPSETAWSETARSNCQTAEIALTQSFRQIAEVTIIRVQFYLQHKIANSAAAGSHKLFIIYFTTSYSACCR